MNHSLSKLALGLVASATFLATSPAIAQDPYDNAYVLDPFGEVVKDPFGNCVRTIEWTAEKEIPECGGAVPVAVEPAPQMVTERMSLEADTFFDFDKATLRPEGRAQLNELADAIRNAQAVNAVDLTGHTDSIGSESYNQQLSERRAQSVADYLVQQGVDPSLISASGQGESNPIAPNTTPQGRDNPAGRAQNRRVDIEVEASEQVMMQSQ